MNENIINLLDHRPHEARYVVCMDCANDWVAVFPVNATALECPECRAMAGEPVQPGNLDWFKRFMAGKEQHRRTLVLLNAQRIGK